jgi:hypothetical protein
VAKFGPIDDNRAFGSQFLVKRMSDVEVSSTNLNSAKGNGLNGILIRLNNTVASILAMRRKLKTAFRC